MNLEKISRLTFYTGRQAAQGPKEKDRPLEDHLQDVHEVLKEKEAELQRVRHEVEVLRLACPLLLDEWEGEGNVVVTASDESASSLDMIRAQLVARQPGVTKTSGKSVLLKFRQVALDASRSLLKRVRDGHLLDPEFQRETA